MNAMIRSCALVIGLGIAMVTVLPAVAAPPVAMHAELLDVDSSDVGNLPGASTRSRPLEVSGIALVGALPFRQGGSWMRVDLDELPGKPVLVVETPMASEITLVLPGGRRLSRSKLDPSATGSSGSNGVTFDLPNDLRAGERLWLHFNQHMRSPVALLLMSEDTWRKREKTTLLATSVICSMLLAFSLISLCYWVILRERMFGNYALLIMAAMLFTGMSAGFIFSWPGGSLLARFGTHGQWSVGVAAIAFAFAFFQDFLSVRDDAPSLVPYFEFPRNIALILAFVLLVSPFEISWVGFFLAGSLLAANAFFLSVAVYLGRRERRYGIYYLIGLLPLLSATSLRGLHGLGVVLPYDFSRFYGVAALCAAFTLTLGITDRLLRLRRQRDATRQVAAQAEESQQALRLREQVDRMSRHDLKTPLGSIVNIPRLMLETGNLTGDQREMMEILDRAAGRLLHMVDHSLDLLKMEQGAYKWTPTNFDLVCLIGRVVVDLRDLAVARSVRFTLDVDGVVDPPARPVTVLADESLCYSLLANLIKNAVEAAPESTPVLLSISSGTRVKLSIHNWGAVPEPVRSKFFEKYNTFGKASGTGFGTYSARLMARIQGGDLHMITSDAEGTTLTLELHAGKLQEEPEPSPESTTESKVAIDIAGLNVMLVDDDDQNLRMLTRLLPTSLLTVRTATNGRTAIEALVPLPADVIFMDLEMPVMNGFKAITALRRHEAASRRRPALAVALSSHDDTGTRTEALWLGFDAYLVKPVKREDLLKALRGCRGVLTQAKAAEVTARSTIVLDLEMRGMLDGFTSSRRELLNELEQAITAAGADEIRALAHRLAGGFALFGFQWAADVCRLIEREGGINEHEALGRIAALRQHLQDADLQFVCKRSAA